MIYISLFGSIGVGKTTLGIELEKKLNDSIFIKEVLNNNIYLKRFYANPSTYAFHSTVEMLALMLANYQKTENKKIVIFDNGLEELICYNNFMKNEGILNEDEYKVYKKLYDASVKIIPKTRLFIYCKLDVDLALERIKQRNREFEKTIDRNFLINLNKCYDDFANQIPKDELIVLDMKHIDIDMLITKIKEKLN